MADFTDQIESILNPPALVPGGLPPLPDQPASFSDEIDAILTPAPSAQPVDVATLGQHAPTTPGPNVDARFILEWVKNNPQEVADLLAQTVGTGIGVTAGGFFGGPAGAITGGAAGNAGAKQLSRLIGREVFGSNAEQPGALEASVDAGLGALGPAAGTLTRLGARAVSGLRKGPFDEAVERVNREITSRANDELDLIWNSMSPTARMRAETTGRTPPAIQKLIDKTVKERRLERDNAVFNEIDAATRAGAQRGTEPGRRVGGGAVGAIIGTSVGDITGGLIAAGISERVVSRAVPALLRNPTLGPKFAKWALEAGEHLPADAMTSLGAIYTGHTLTREERAAVDELRAALPSRPAPRTPDAVYDANVDRHRDPSSGKFAPSGGPVRHGEDPWGHHPDDDDDADAQ